MATGIQWTDTTWNPTVGCTRVSPGCDHCYAFLLHDKRHLAWKRGRWPDAPAQYRKPFSTVQLLPDRLTDPLRWRKPRRVFVDSMADLFHEDVPDEYLDRVFAVMALTPQHTYQVLTKRPERMREYVTALVEGQRWVWGATKAMLDPKGDGLRRAYARADEANDRVLDGPLSSVWLGVSAEDQERADERVPLLLDTPAAVRFVSAEPLLGPIDFTPWIGGFYGRAQDRGPWMEARAELSWVIVGGESGRGARPFDLAWVRSIRDQCREAGVALFVKQLGSRPGFNYPYEAGDPWTEIRLRHSHGGDPEEWPEDLRIREWPRVEATA